MPLKFDLQQYKPNWDPLAGGPFVSIQDVLSATSQMWVEVLTTMVEIIPTTAEDIIPIIAESMPTLMAAIGGAIEQDVIVWPLSWMAGSTQYLLSGFTSYGQVSSTTINALDNPNFLSPQSVSGSTDWVWDASISPNDTTVGSVYVDADGTEHTLKSNMVDVTPTDVLDLSVMTTWTGAAGTGTPIQLNVLKYADGVLQGTDPVAAISSLTAQSDWITLSGSYSVPAGIDRVASELAVTSTMTAGRVHFSDASYVKVGQIQQPWIAGITAGAVSLEQDFYNVFAVFGGAGAGLAETAYAWTNMLALFGIDGAATLAVTPFNATSFLASWVSDTLIPLNLLAQIGSDGLLLAGQTPQIVFDVIATMNDAWTGLATALNPVALVSEAMAGIFGAGSTAVASNAIQDAQIAALQAGAGAVSNYDTFGGAASLTLDSTKWIQNGFGPGAGNYGIDGSGNAVAFNGSPSLSYDWQNIFSTPLATNTQVVAVALANDLQFGDNSLPANNPSITLQGRENAAGTTRVEAYVDVLGCKVGYVIAGTYTMLDSFTFAGGYSTAGTWTLELGTDTSDYEFVLLHDNVEILRVTDTAAASAMGTSNLFTGFQIQIGWNITVFFTFFSVPPPPVTSFASADRAGAPATPPTTGGFPYTLPIVFH